MEKENNFYCQNESGDVDFSIDEWNEIAEKLELTNLTEKGKTEILFPEKCKIQCIDCACIVGEQRLKTTQLTKQI